MKKNRLQRLKEDIDRDVQKQLDENTVDTTPKLGKTHELNFWIHVAAFILVFACGFMAWAGRILGDKQAIVQYGIVGVFLIVIILFYIWLRKNINKRKDRISGLILY